MHWPKCSDKNNNDEDISINKSLTHFRISDNIDKIFPTTQVKGLFRLIINKIHIMM